MILAIDGHKLSTKNPTGIDVVTEYFLENLDQPIAYQFDQIYLYCKQKPNQALLDKLPKNVTLKCFNMPLGWSKLGLSWKMYWHTPDILFVPSHSLPSYCPRKSTLIIHDIGFHEYQENYSARQFQHLKSTIASDIKRAAVIFTPSEFVKKTIIDYYFADPNKIIVNHLGYDEKMFRSNYSQQQINKVIKKYDKKISSRPYIFYVGRLEYRKNIVNMIKSFEIFKEQTKYPHVLVLGGTPSHGYDEIKTTINNSKYQNDIIEIGYIPKKHLPIFYNEADLFLFPSSYEGFGLPILEAQACRTPVISSNLSSLPEVGGQGALYVDPHNIDDIAHAIKKTIENPAFKQYIIEKGIINLQRFSWVTFTNTILQNLYKLGKKI